MANEAEWEAARQEVLRRMGDFRQYFSDLRGSDRGDKRYVECACPFHKGGEERTFSFSFNRENGHWKCFAGCGKGSYFDYVAKREKKDFKEVFLELAEKYGVELPGKKDTRPPIPDKLVDQWARALFDDESVLTYIREKRMLKDDIIKKYKIGWNAKKGRNTIPIRDHKGIVRNVRLYNAKKHPKILNYTDGKQRYGSPPRLFGVGALSKAKPGSQVVLCEGEWDKLLLSQEGFLTVTGTGGCTTFEKVWLKWFKEMKVVVIYDCDPEGRAAVKNVVIPAMQKAKVESLKVVWLPLKGTKEEKDPTDYFRLDHSAADLQKIIDETKDHVFEDKTNPDDGDPIELKSFTEIIEKKYVNKKVVVDVTVCGQTSEDFHAVDRFRVTHCKRLNKGGCFDCKGYPEPCDVPKSGREYIGSCMSSDFQVRCMLRDFACAYGESPKIEIMEQSTIKEFFCHQRVNRRTHVRDNTGNIVELLDGRQQEMVEKRVYFHGHKQPDPKSYRVTGWVKSHPKTQQVTLLIDKMEPLEEDYESFKVEEHIDILNTFKKIDWSDLINDLRENVTRIYERDELLVATLLTYCSPRWIPFNNDVIRGWMVTAIIGDAGSGKTQTTTRLSEFLGMGDIFSGLTGSRTGLAYALADHKQKGWQVKVGRYPANTRKLLTVDEAQYIATEDLRTLAKAMEEGWLQIDRVSSHGFESQTRLILISNAKWDKIMDAYTYGAQALKSVYPPTIIRRIDMALIASASDISDLSLINRAAASGDTPPVITPEMLRAVVMWGWKLSPNQITWEDGAEQMCLDEAKRMGNTFGHATDVPLVTLSDFRNKLARIAAAMAVLRVSANEDYTKLVITKSHVHSMSRFLERLYSGANCMLDHYSQIVREQTELMDYESIEEAFLRKVEAGKHAKNGRDKDFQRILYGLRVNEAIRRDDLVEQSGAGKNTVHRVIKLLRRFNLVDSDPKGYRKSPRCNRFFRRFLEKQPDFFEGIQGLNAEDDLFEEKEEDDNPFN